MVLEVFSNLYESMTHGKFIPIIYSGLSIVTHSFELCSIGWGSAGESFVASQGLGVVLHSCMSCTSSTNLGTFSGHLSEGDIPRLDDLSMAP